VLQVGLTHGKMSKICPHTSTGRADYFGTTVNRAARLLMAANAGQILVEASVMDGVFKQWSGSAYNLAPMPLSPDSTKGSSFNVSGKATQGAALIESGNLVLPDLPDASDDGITGTPRIKSAPQLSLFEIPGNNAATADVGRLQLKDEDGGASLPRSSAPPLQLDQAERSESDGAKAWIPRDPHTGIRSSIAGAPGRFGKHSAVSFAPQIRKGRTLSRASTRRSIDGVSYDNSELEQLDMLDSCCAPYAADSPLAVSNCHMLKFLAASGTMQGRKEDVVVPRHLSDKSPRASSLSTGNSPQNSQELRLNVSALRSDSSSTTAAGSRRPSLLGPQDSKLPVITERKPRGVSCTTSLSLCCVMLGCRPFRSQSCKDMECCVLPGSSVNPWNSGGPAPICS